MNKRKHRLKYPLQKATKVLVKTPHFSYSMILVQKFNEEVIKFIAVFCIKVKISNAFVLFVRYALYSISLKVRIKN